MYSEEHKNYLKKIKRYNFSVKLIQIVILLAFLIIWQVLASTEKINTFIFSSPLAVFDTIISLYQEDNLLYHIWITVYETLVGFALGCALGILIASILWINKFIFKIVDPYLTILNSLPKVSLGPIIIIIAGASTNSIIIMALFISVIVTIINVHQAFTSTDENKIRLLKSFKAKPHQIYFKLILPSNYKNLISSCKINIGLVFIGVIMGEFLVSKAGVGYLIMYGSQVFNLNLVITGIFILCIVATLMYYVVVLVEKKLSNK